MRCGEPAARAAASWSSESLSAGLGGRRAGRRALPSAGEWGPEAAVAHGDALGRGGAGSEEPGSSAPSFRGSAGARALTGALPGARAGWAGRLGGLCCGFWAAVPEGAVGGSPWDCSSSESESAVDWGVLGAAPSAGILLRWRSGSSPCPPWGEGGARARGAAWREGAGGGAALQASSASAFCRASGSLVLAGTGWKESAVREEIQKLGSTQGD